ncbi:GPI inositol deacylase [Branchiostoma belcheri]|nr:GPI inositol deacylase [Branchiostoma belcheri]
MGATRLPLSLLVLLGTLRVIVRVSALPPEPEMSTSILTENNGTTLHLEEIFLGRCWDFQRLWKVSPDINCTGLWDKFFHAFSNRDPCDQKPSYYDDFFSASAFDTPSAEKTLFWSGTTVLAHEYSNDGLRYTTLEDTLPGYVLNGLRWCGSLSEPWYNEKTCPKCPPSVPWDSFWRAASRSFAKRARGDVFVMLSGTRKDQEGKPIDAFVNTSYFGMEELPNLDQQKVSKVNVWVMHDLIVVPPYREACGKGSLIQLDQELSRRGFLMDCTDDPPGVQPPGTGQPPQDDHVNAVNYKERLKVEENFLPRRKIYSTLVLT